MDQAPSVRIRLFGAPEISVDGREVEFDTRKAIALLAYLATTGRAHQRDAMAGMLWPDYDQTRARAALRRTLSTLRKGLEDRAVQVDRSTIGLDTEAAETDVVEFRRLLAEVDDHAHGEGPCAACSEALTRAVALYQGDLLAGFALRDSAEFDDWHFFEAESLRRELSKAIERLARWALDAGDVAEAVELARRWVSLDPLHEPAHQLLMRAHAAAGDRAAMARQYRELVRVLDDELGVAPLTETTRLYEEVAARAAAPVEVEVVPPEPDAPQVLPLVGRDDAIEAARSALLSGGLLVVEGEAGVGKSRLADEVAATSPSVVRAAGHASSSGLAYALVADLLRSSLELVDASVLEPRVLAEAARLVPGVARGDLPAVPTLDQPGALAGFLEGLVEVIARAAASSGPGLVIVDDLQWADEASLDALSHLARRVVGSRSLLLFIWRSEEVGPGHRLRALLAELRREGHAREIRLERLDETATRELTGAAGVTDAATARRLFEETEGLPFFLVEYLRSGGEPGMPAGARDLLTTRLHRTTETARQVLTAAAVLGGPIDADLIRETSGRTEDETVAAIDELVGIGLLRELGTDDAYAFGHEKMRELVYDDAGPARRRSLHRRAAEAFGSRIRRSGDQGLQAALAHHLRASGADEEAAIASQAAGDHARRLFANEDALRHYERALSLHPHNVEELHEAIGDVAVLIGDYQRALLSFERAASGLPDGLARLEVKIAEVHQRAGHWDLAELHHAAALEATTGKDAALRSRIAADRSLTARRRGDVDAARALAMEGLDLATSAAEPHALARVRNILGIISLAEGDTGGAIEHLERSLVASEELEDPSARIAALNNLASAHRAAGEVDEALGYARSALELCASQGDRHREAALHSNMADLLHASGRPDEALVHLKEAASLFTAVGGGSVMEPEIWKLVEW